MPPSYPSGFPLGTDTFKGGQNLDILPDLLNRLAEEDASETKGNLHLYADGTNGDDNNSGLTATAPKKTLQAAVDLVPMVIKHLVTVHLEGVFTEDTDIACTFIGCGYGSLLLDGGPDVEVVDDNGGANYLADGASTINSIVAQGAPGWTTSPEEHLGYLIEMVTGPAAGCIRLVHSHTADTITPDFKMVGGTPGAGDEFRIVKQATTLAGDVDLRIAFLGASTSIEPGSPFRISELHLQRFRMDAGSQISMFGAAGGSLRVSNVQGTVGTPINLFNTGFCNIVGHLKDGDTHLLDFFGTNATHYGFGGILGVGDINVYNGAEVFMFGVVADDIRISDTFAQMTGIRAKSISVESGQPRVVTINEPALQQGSGRAANLITGGAGVTISGGSRWSIGGSVIQSGTGDGITVQDGSTVKLAAGVSGTGNAGYGARAKNGGRILTTSGSAPTVTGASGDLIIGSTAVGGGWTTVDGAAQLETTDSFCVAKVE